MIVKEMEDCSAAIFDGDGRLLSESASIPIHLNCIGLCLRTILDHYVPLDSWEEGDVVLTNDPYAGGGSLSSHHTNDVIAYTPIFWNGKRVAFAALNVHHMDVGATWMGMRGWPETISPDLITATRPVPMLVISASGSASSRRRSARLPASTVPTR